MDAYNNNTWRSGLPQDSRQKIVKRIVDTLQRHMPPTGQESMGELLKIAWRLEEKIFHAATDQQDYLRRISLKIFSLEAKAQASPSTGIQSTLGSNVGKPLDAGAAMMMPNQAQNLNNGVQLSSSVSGQAQQRQQLLAQSLQNNLNANVMQSSSGLSGMPQAALSGSSGLDMMINAQRLQMHHARQQHQQQQQQQQQTQQQPPQQQQASAHEQYILQLQQLQQQLVMKRRLQQQQPLQQQVPALQQQQQPANQLMPQTANVPSTSHQQLQLFLAQLLHDQKLVQQLQQQQQSQQQQQQVQQQQPTALQFQSQQFQQPNSTQQLGQQPQQLQQLQSANQQSQQQRLQQPSVLNQQQSIIYDIQQHQKQRTFPESSNASVDSSTGVDHREVVWPKLQVLKDKHLRDMTELYGMLTQRSAMPMPPEQLQKLQHYKDVLHRMIPYLTVPKERVPPEFNQVKVEAFEKQIVNIMETFRRHRQTPLQLPVLPPQQQLQPNQVPHPPEQQQAQQQQCLLKEQEQGKQAFQLLQMQQQQQQLAQQLQQLQHQQQKLLHSSSQFTFLIRIAILVLILLFISVRLRLTDYFDI